MRVVRCALRGPSPGASGAARPRVDLSLVRVRERCNPAPDALPLCSDDAPSFHNPFSGVAGLARDAGVLRHDCKSSSVIVSAIAISHYVTDLLVAEAWHGQPDQRAILQRRAKSSDFSGYSILPPLTDDD